MLRRRQPVWQTGKGTQFGSIAKSTCPFTSVSKGNQFRERALKGHPHWSNLAANKDVWRKVFLGICDKNAEIMRIRRVIHCGNIMPVPAPQHAKNAMSAPSPIETFLSSDSYAVAGASTNPSKYGNKVFHALLRTGRTVYPLNPNSSTVDGHAAYAALADLPLAPEALSIVTPPEITAQIIQDAISTGVKSIWMQPGAENPEASKLAREAGMNVIDDGSCILVALTLDG